LSFSIFIGVCGLKVIRRRDETGDRLKGLLAFTVEAREYIRILYPLYIQLDRAYAAIPERGKFNKVARP